MQKKIQSTGSLTLVSLPCSLVSKAADIVLKTGSGISGAVTGAVKGGIEGVKQGGLKKDERMRGF